MRRRRNPAISETRSARSGVKRWLTPSRNAGRTAFLLQRVTGLGMTVYFVVHVLNTGIVVGGEEAWKVFLGSAETPIGKPVLVLLLAALGFHFVNGVRLALGEFGVTLSRPRRPDYPYRLGSFNWVQKVIVASALMAAVVFALLGYLFVFLGA